MLRSTPPSARTAPPLMVTDCVLATNATTAAISSGVSQRFQQRTGTASGKELFFHVCFRHAPLLSHLLHKRANAFKSEASRHH